MFHTTVILRIISNFKYYLLCALVICGFQRSDCVSVFGLVSDDQCSDSADLHECGNGFCVSSDVKCSADVRVCGTQDTSCEPEVDEETTMTIVKMFQYFLVGMFILFVLVTVKMFCKRLKQTRDTDNCLESCCTGFCGCLFAMKQVGVHGRTTNYTYISFL